MTQKRSKEGGGTITTISSSMEEGWCKEQGMQNRSQLSNLAIREGDFFFSSLKCEPNGSSNRERMP